MKDLKLKANVDKASRVENKFWEKYKSNENNTDDLLESAITVIKLKGIIITELNRKIYELEQELLEVYTENLNTD